MNLWPASGVLVTVFPNTSVNVQTIGMSLCEHDSGFVPEVFIAFEIKPNIGRWASLNLPPGFGGEDAC